jgi:hypothetical protein
MKETKCFIGYIDLLGHLGYKRGLTYQSMPYNFTYSYRSNKLNRIFRPNLERLKQLTNKRVILVGHSLGNINIKYQLDKMTQHEKDSYIENWLALSPPFMGSLIANKGIIEGNSNFYFGGFFGFHFSPSHKSLSSFAVEYELFLKNMYQMYQTEDWFEWVQQILAYEKGHAEQSPLNFWPSKNEICLPKFKGVNRKCLTGLEDIRNKPSIVVGQHKYYLDDMQEIITNWTIQDNVLQNNQTFADPNRFKLLNPGVPLVLVYSRATPTISQVQYTDDILTYISQGKYPPVKNTYSVGDGTVSPNSALVPAIKWAYQFDKYHRDRPYTSHSPYKV